MQKLARPFGLRGKWRHAALRGWKREPPFSASRAWPGAIWRSNAVRAETSTDPSLDEIHDLLQLDDGTHCLEASTLAERKLHDVRGKLEKLQQIEALLSDMVDRCCAYEGNISCPLIASLHEGVGRKVSTYPSQSGTPAKPQ
ncbi:MerR family DNA-binding protein [Salinicola sp. NYA28a]